MQAVQSEKKARSQLTYGIEVYRATLDIFFDELDRKVHDAAIAIALHCVMKRASDPEFKDFTPKELNQKIRTYAAHLDNVDKAIRGEPIADEEVDKNAWKIAPDLAFTFEKRFPELAASRNAYWLHLLLDMKIENCQIGRAHV